MWTVGCTEARLPAEMATEPAVSPAARWPSSGLVVPHSAFHRSRDCRVHAIPLDHTRNNHHRSHMPVAHVLDLEDLRQQLCQRHAGVAVEEVEDQANERLEFRAAR